MWVASGDVLALEEKAGLPYRLQKETSIPCEVSVSWFQILTVPEMKLENAVRGGLRRKSEAWWAGQDLCQNRLCVKFPVISSASSPVCGTGQELQECSDQ